MSEVAAIDSAPWDTDEHGVPLDGADAMLRGWDLKANPYTPENPSYLDWVAQWHTANALAYRAHLDNRTPPYIPSRTAFGIICSEYQRLANLHRLSPGNYVQHFATSILNRLAEGAARDAETSTTGAHPDA